LEDDSRSELLCDRPESKPRIGRVRDIPFHIRLPVRALVNDLPIFGDEYRAIELPVLMRCRKKFPDLRGMVLRDGDVWGDKKNDCDTKPHSVL